MANTQDPRGFTIAGRILSMHEYVKGATAAYPGDLMVMNSGGKATCAAAGGTQIVGVAASYAAASTTTVLLYDDPDQQYYVQDDGVSATLAQTDVGMNADVVATVGSGTLLKSKMALDTDSHAVTTAQLRILGFHPADSIAKYVRCRVVVNEHHWAKKTGGI